MPAFTHHIFVCCNRREPGSARGCCDPDGSEALRSAFKAELKKRAELKAQRMLLKEPKRKPKR